MTKKSLVKYTGKDYEKYLSGKSVLELVDTLTFLDSIKPYAECSDNGEVGEFLEKKYKDIPIHNVKDFSSFYESLKNKLGELADTKESVKRYLENASYQRELKELPNLMNKLERISLDELTPKFEAVMEYVYDAVMEHGFNMENEKFVICRGFNDKIKPKGGKVCIEINEKSTILNLFKNKKKQDLRIQILSFIGEDQSSKKNYYPIIRDVESLIEGIENFLQENNFEKKEYETLVKDMKTILSLPKIMNNYLKNKIRKIENYINEIKK